MGGVNIINDKLKHLVKGLDFDDLERAVEDFHRVDRNGKCPRDSAFSSPEMFTARVGNSFYDFNKKDILDEYKRRRIKDKLRNMR